MSKPKEIPAWHAEAAAALNSNFAPIDSAFHEAKRRAIWYGMFLIHVKERGKADKSIPHGQFKKWIKLHLPDIPRTTVASYITSAKELLGKIKLSHKKFQALEFSTDGKLPKQIEEGIAKVESRFQLHMEYKQSKIEDDALVTARGRIKGQGGATKKQREDAQARKERLRREKVEVWSINAVDTLKEYADAKHFGELTDETKQALADAMRLALPFLKVG